MDSRGWQAIIICTGFLRLHKWSLFFVHSSQVLIFAPISSYCCREYHFVLNIWNIWVWPGCTEQLEKWADFSTLARITYGRTILVFPSSSSPNFSRRQSRWTFTPPPDFHPKLSCIINHPSGHIQATGWTKVLRYILLPVYWWLETLPTRRAFNIVYVLLSFSIFCFLRPYWFQFINFSCDLKCGIP